MTRLFIWMVIFIFPFLTVNCQEVHQTSVTKSEDNKTLSFVKKDGILKVNIDKNRSCLLADDAIAYETYVSPKATWIAVETQLLSNIQIIRLYKKNSDGCYKPLKSPLSVELWHTLTAKKGFSIDDVLHPRMQFLKWIDNEQILIALSGEIGNKAIDVNVSYDLRVFHID